MGINYKRFNVEKDTPVPALTGTASTKMNDHVKISLSIKKETLTIFPSPNRTNNSLRVLKVKQQKYLQFKLVSS